MRIVIIGGGPAGTVAAVTLAGRGRDVVVAESSTGPDRKVGECLSPGAGPMLAMLGLDAAMEDAAHLPSVGRIACRGDGTPAERDVGRRGGGWHLDRKCFEADLACVAVAGGVRSCGGHRLRHASRDGDLWRLDFDASGAPISMPADHVIDASGRPRTLTRRLAAVEPARLPGGDGDRLLGLAGVFAPCGAHRALRDRRTLVEATELGWWYTALLGDGALVAVAMTDADLLPAVDAWDLLLAPAEQTRRRIACHGGDPSGRPRTRVASGSRLGRAHGTGWTAVGDAALAFDPLSSYGITSAMGTAYYGAHAVADTLAGDVDAMAAFQAVLDRTWDADVCEHAVQYDPETRWPGAAPLRSRRGRPGGPAGA